MLKRIALITLLAATTAITGCANSDVYSGDVYTKDRAKQVQTVSYGTILSTRPVKIQADENSLIGTIGGAVVGGLLGSTIGGGSRQRHRCRRRCHRGRSCWQGRR